jgi:two-component system, OmpR family, phosphate regulon sensor histidine kinase PhoR
MFWPLLTAVCLMAMAALHLWWRNRFAREQRTTHRAIATLQDTQHRTKADSESRQAALFDSMAEGVLVLDQADRIQLANRALTELLGGMTDLRSRTIMEAFRLHELSELVKRLVTEKQVLGYELKVLRPNERWLQVNGAALLNESGARQGTLLVFHDLTRLKQLERTRQEFVANVSHELRTPLSLIKGYVETLLDGAKDNPEIAAKFLQTIDRNAERLTRLIEDLLTISELESGRIKLNLQPVPLRAVVGKVVADFKAPAEQRQIKLVNETSEVLVRADPDRLEQVLFNLIDNAIKYGKQSGLVTVSVKRTEGDFIQVCVQDNGPGMPPEALERVFERFYRADKARSREQGGTGLGLSIVKHIVQSHGGRVWAKSEPGNGAAFYFTLPQDVAGLQQSLL